MLRLLPALALAALLLIAQLASTAMQLCLEEDGSVNIELAGRDCGPYVSAPESPEATAGNFFDQAAPPTSLQSSEEVCPCLDFGLALVLRGSNDLNPVGKDLQHLYPTDLPIAMVPSPELALTGLAPAIGWQASSWLEQQDLLAWRHAAHAVVMRC